MSKWHSARVITGARQVGGKAAARGHVDRDAFDHALCVVADFVGVVEIVTLAGHHHVVVAVRAQLDRAQQLPRGERGAAREQRRLRFLAAETATHAPAFDQYVMRCNAQRVRDEVLHFGRMLGRAVDVHAVVVLRHRVRDLPFQIELLLAAEPHLTGLAMRGTRHLRASVAARELHRRQHELVRGARLLRAQHRRQFLVDHLGAPCAEPRRLVRRRDHDQHRLADVLHDAVGEDRIVAMNDRADVVDAGDVVGGEDRDDAGRRAHLVERDRDDLRVRLRRQPQRRVQRAGQLGNVVGVGRAAAYVQMRGLVRTRHVHLGEVVEFLNLFQERFGLLVHGCVLRILERAGLRRSRRPARPRARRARFSAAAAARAFRARSGTACSSPLRGGSRCSRACR
ncbi:hypothetical protein OKW36_007112 [Paraburkholderia sp. MM5482-R1]